jgi:hypothetical protein
MSIIDQREHGSSPICYRFTEVSRCRTKLVDAMLLIDECFREVAGKKGETG